MKLFDTAVSAYYSVKSRVASFAKDQNGVTAIEYAVVAAGVAGVVIAVFGSDGSFSKALTNVFADLTKKLNELIGTKATS